MKQLSARVVVVGVVTLLGMVAAEAVLAQEAVEPPKPVELPADATMKMTTPEMGAASMPSLEEMIAAEQDEDIGALDVVGVGPDRATFRVFKWQRGSTFFISANTVAYYCGDYDGCELRMGMYNWDNTGRTASRHSLFYYNPGNRAWRAERSDAAGSDWNGVTQHVMNAWACYFTDGVYSNWSNLGDPNAGFGLLSWNQYNAECRLTIID